jgi:hypothetical protein
VILRAVRAAFTRLGAADVRNRLKSVKSVKSTVNVQVASAQRALVSNKLEPRSRRVQPLLASGPLSHRADARFRTGRAVTDLAI